MLANDVQIRLLLSPQKGIRFTRLSDGMIQRRLPRGHPEPWRNTGAYTAYNVLSDESLHFLFMVGN